LPGFHKTNEKKLRIIWACDRVRKIFEPSLIGAALGSLILSIESVTSLVATTGNVIRGSIKENDNARKQSLLINKGNGLIRNLP
jgi:hypothetical protein